GSHGAAAEKAHRRAASRGPPFRDGRPAARRREEARALRQGLRRAAGMAFPARRARAPRARTGRLRRMDAGPAFGRARPPGAAPPHRRRRPRARDLQPRLLRRGAGLPRHRRARRKIGTDPIFRARAAISAEMALRLSAALGGSAVTRLGLRAAYALYM